MNDLLITQATEFEKTWAAELMAKSEPWTTLGVTLEKSLIACRDGGNHVYIAHDHIRWQRAPASFVFSGARIPATGF